MWDFVVDIVVGVDGAAADDVNNVDIWVAVMRVVVAEEVWVVICVVVGVTGRLHSSSVVAVAPNTSSRLSMQSSNPSPIHSAGMHPEI